MIKEKRLLIYFISFLLGLFTFLFINIIKVKADTVIAPVQYVTNDTNFYISNNKGTDIQLNSTVQNNNNIDIKKIVMNINYNFKGNVIYQIELSTPTQYLINVNNVSILSSDNTCSFKEITDANVGFPKIRFTCPYDTSYITIGLSNLSDKNITSSYNFRWNYTYLSIVNENVVNLNPVLDGQAGIKDDIKDSTNTITGEINDMEQSIVDSNKETQDVIKDQFNSCRDSVNLFNENIYTPSATSGYSLKNLDVGKNYTISINRNPNNSNYGFLIKISTGSTLTPDMWETYTNKSATFTYTKAMYDNDYKLYIIDTINYNPISIEVLKSLKIQLQEGTVSTQYEPYGEEICQNKIDDTNDKLNGIQGALTDSSAPNTSGLENSAGWLPAGPLDSILNLPLTMLNSLTNSLGKTCSPLNLKLPYVNKNIQIPCLSAIFAQITGVNGLWAWVGTIASVLILYNYLLNLYAWVDRVLTLRAEFDEAMGADMANWGRL